MDKPRPDQPGSPEPGPSPVPPPSSPADSPPVPPADPADGVTFTSDSTPAPEETRRIGPYRILQRLGSGGMGEVYHAEQEHPVRRPVALKLIKLGMDTKEVIARFESERQALALLNHPNIAHVLDAGATPSGRPYFVMELVQGIPITKYCQQQRLSLPDRLKLFCEMCEGVQHAHQKGIIHRDLKPSNILVTIQDGRPVAKIIDFGVAKATAQRLTDRTLVTEIGFAVGTPGYMSPEQAGTTALDIDTRSDVYSLGVVLYELLVGRIPFGPEQLRAMGMDAYVRALQEKDPPRPSTRLDIAGADAAAAARERRTEALALRRQIRGDLDWIVLRALEKERTRRYGSVSDLAEDIRRHLRHEPVVAGPPSALYRTLKFVRRHRVGVAASAVVVLALIGGIVGTSVGLLRAVRAERRATREAETARRATDFLVGLFQVSDPDSAKGSEITARALLDEGSRQIRHELSDRPILRARLLGVMGNVYGNLGLYAESDANFKEALSTLDATRNAEPVEVVRTLNGYAHLLALAGRSSESEQLAKRALQIGLEALGENAEEVGWSLYYLGGSYVMSGQLVKTEEVLQRALLVFRAALGPNSLPEAWCLNDLGLVNQKRGGEALKDAIRYYEESAKMKERLYGPEHRDVALALNNLGYTHGLQGDYAEAERFLGRSIAIYKEVVGTVHPATAQAMHSLGETYRRKGDLASARDVLLETLAIQTRVLGSEHTELALTLCSLGAVHSGLGESATAEREFRRAEEIYDENGGVDNADIIFCLDEYARHLDRVGKEREAGRARERAAEARARTNSSPAVSSIEGPGAP